VKAKAILCVALGHHWTTHSETFDSEPLLYCTRCGRHRDMGNETHGFTPWMARGASPIGRMSGQTGRDGRPY